MITTPSKLLITSNFSSFFKVALISIDLSALKEISEKLPQFRPSLSIDEFFKLLIGTIELVSSLLNIIFLIALIVGL